MKGFFMRGGIARFIGMGVFLGAMAAPFSLFAASGGGGSPSGPNPLPQAPPSPEIIQRESFGQGPQLLRPAGGKGTLKSSASGGTSINGFWLEYLGTKDFRWITGDSGVTWRFCGTNLNPNEIFSPLQVVFGEPQNSIACNLLNVPPVAPNPAPSALIALKPGISAPYEIEINGSYHPVPGAYFAFGLTNSAVTSGNLSSSGALFFVMRPGDETDSFVSYELRMGGMNGQLLASGIGEDISFNRIIIRYDPQTRAISASYNGAEMGTFQTAMPPARYAAFEGVGYADNFVVRRLQ